MTDKNTHSGSVHWSEQKEITRSRLPLQFLLFLCRILPSPLLRITARPVSFFYYLCTPRARNACIAYQKQFISYTDSRIISRPHPYCQILAFSLSLIEKIQGWSGSVFLKSVHFQNDGVQDLIRLLESGHGAVAVTSHLGNAELLRSLMQFNRTAVNRNFPVITIGDVKTTAHFNSMLKQLNPGYDMRMITGENITPATIEMLENEIAAGALVVMTGDRTSAATRNRTISLPFLGKNAPFPYGVFFLAALLNAPLYYIFAVREKDTGISLSYEMHVHKSSVSFDCPRKEREKHIHEACAAYARFLETYCLQHPYQWYNFYDFWALPESTDTSAPDSMHTKGLS